MKKYLGVKLIEANPMNLGEYNKCRGWVIPENEDPTTEGYLVQYPDGYISWSPKEVFEKAYFELAEDKPNSISDSDVSRFVRKVEVSTINKKTTIVVCTLINGFEICESSSCVDPANYDQSLGVKCCMGKITDKIWGYLGFLLQSGVSGVVPNKQLPKSQEKRIAVQKEAKKEEKI